MVRRGPALCVGSGPSPLSPLGGSPWVTGCLKPGQEHQSSLVSSTGPTFLLAQPPPHHPPVRTHFFAPQSSFHIQGTPQPPTAAVGETPFLQSPPGQGKTPGPAPQPDRVATMSPGVRAVPLPQPSCGLSVPRQEERLFHLCLFRERETKASRNRGREGDKQGCTWEMSWLVFQLQMGNDSSSMGA